MSSEKPSSSCPTPPPHYTALGVASAATQREIERAYRQLSLKLHPDRAAYRNDPSQEPHVHARYLAITEAYTVLSDPQQRSAYDVQFGVNFLSRVHGLSQAIDSHNAEARQRQATKRTREEEEARGNGAPASSAHEAQTVASEKSGRATTVAANDDDEEEEEEEYAPVACAGQAGSTVPLRRTAIPLTLQKTPRTVTSTAQVYNTVELHRPFTGTPDWGLSVVGHVLQHADVDGGVPFPAVIDSINGRPVRGRKTIADMIRDTTTAEPVTIEGCDAPQTTLSLTLLFTQDSYELVGDLSVLTDEATLDLLVPSTQCTTELRTLLPGFSVRTVNDVAVHTAAELRAALAQAAQTCMDSGRFARGIVLVCPSIDGVPLDTS